jgi:hypothetical protein
MLMSGARICRLLFMQILIKSDVEDHCNDGQQVRTRSEVRLSACEESALGALEDCLKAEGAVFA